MRVRAKGVKKESQIDDESIREKEANVKSEVDNVLGRLEDSFIPNQVLFRD